MSVATHGGAQDTERPPATDEDRLAVLEEAVRAVARERDWEQFHQPKNLVLALVGEMGELAELFPWGTPGESEAASQEPETSEAVRAELADVFLYLVRLSNVLGIDLVDAAHAKPAANAERYPPAESRGSVAKRG